MAVICPFEGSPCFKCEYYGYDDEEQQRGCYYGKPQDVIKQARENKIRHDIEVREYHLEEARIGDL